MPRIIVSLTSYPERIPTIERVLNCIINQSIKPDKILLYLAEEQFQDKNFMYKLEKFEEFGLELRWCQEDLGPHKKYFYTMQEFYNDIIITLDDDILYRNTTIETLLMGYKKYPYAVVTRRAHLVTCLEKGMLHRIRNGIKNVLDMLMYQGWI